jgi:hypothetical protein
MVGRGGVGDTDPAGYVPQAEVLWSHLGQRRRGGVDHLLAKVPLIVDPDTPAGLHLRLFPQLVVDTVYLVL